MDANILALASKGAHFIVNTVLVPKALSGSKCRLCVNYHNLNIKTVQDYFAIHHVTNTLDQLGTFEWFTLLDLKTGYHNILIAIQS